MKTKKLIESNTFVHKEHKDWLSQLNFYQDEIKFFQNELALVFRKHLSSMSLIESADEYKKILLKKLYHIDDLRHKVMLHEKQLAGTAIAESGPVDTHQSIREEFLQFVEDFELLKKNFKRFVAHNN